MTSERLKDFGYAVFAILVAAATLYVGFPKLVDAIRVTVDGEEATGRIVQVRESCSQGSCSHTATVRYSVADQDYESEMIVDAEAYRQAEIVVHYHPSDPAIALSSSFDEFWVGGLSTLIGVGALLGAGFFLWAGIRGGASPFTRI